MSIWCDLHGFSVSYMILLEFLHIFNIIQKYALPANRWNLHAVDWTRIRLLYIYYTQWS